MPGQPAQIVVGEVGDELQAGVHGQGSGASQQQLHAHKYPDRVGRAEDTLDPGQIDPALPQPRQQLDGQGGEAQRFKRLPEGADRCRAYSRNAVGSTPSPSPDARRSTPWRPGHGRSPVEGRRTRRLIGNSRAGREPVEFWMIRGALSS